jgi:hypothetical protein
VPTDRGDDERECVIAFGERTSYHVGQSVTCSKPHGGRAVLLGDAPAPFPAIGQGFNAAMESAVVLDGFLAEPGVDPPNLEWTRATLPHGTRGMEAPLKLRFLDGVSFSGLIWASGGVDDLADELFENVFEGNQAAGLAVLVDQACEV